jgi:sarcosine oxidase subunit alpha
MLSRLVKDETIFNKLKSGDVADFKVAEIPVRLMGVGFVSESAYEMHVPTNQAMALWNKIIEAGQPYNLQPFGTEAQRILRLEMGHALIGHDTDGLTNPIEAGYEFALKMQKPFFVGQRSLKIVQKKSLNKKLVPFILDALPENPAPLECNLVIEQGEIKGRITSIAFSPILQKYIGLAYVHPTQSSFNTTFEIRTDNGNLAKAIVVDTPFLKVGV